MRRRERGLLPMAAASMARVWVFSTATGAVVQPSWMYFGCWLGLLIAAALSSGNAGATGDLHGPFLGSNSPTKIYVAVALQLFALHERPEGFTVTLLAKFRRLAWILDLTEVVRRNTSTRSTENIPHLPPPCLAHPSRPACRASDTIRSPRNTFRPTRTRTR